MGELYLRKVVLEIFPANGASKKIEDLRIKFKCEKTNEGKPHKSKIEIFNLSEQTRSMLEAKNTRVRVAIGYLGLKPGGLAGSGIGSTSSVETVLIGTITKVAHKTETADRITTVEVADGGNKYRNARLDKGYPPNVKLKDVIADLTEELGLPKGAQDGIPDKNYANGLSLSGPIRDHLNKLCQANGLEWSIQDETLQIIPTGKATSDSILEISPDSGLVGSPAKTDKGVEFETLLQPTIRPGRRVKIKSRDVNGIFKVRRVDHEGDSHQGTFLSKCQATK